MRIASAGSTPGREKVFHCSKIKTYATKYILFSGLRFYVPINDGQLTKKHFSPGQA